MWRVFDWVLFAASLFIGAVVLLFAQKSRQRRAREAILRHRNGAKEKVKQEKTRAENEMKPQSHYLSYIKGKEEKENGLIILSARYGNLREEYRMNTGKENDVFEVIIDVKDPLQLLVQNSKLTLKEGSKNQLQGFYDPCPQEPKNLEIKYKFNGCAYKVTINDTAPLNLPSSIHLAQ